jgi:hypothetical protein
MEPTTVERGKCKCREVKKYSHNVNEAQHRTDIEEAIDLRSRFRGENQWKGKDWCEEFR